MGSSKQCQQSFLENSVEGSFPIIMREGTLSTVGLRHLPVPTMASHLQLQPDQKQAHILYILHIMSSITDEDPFSEHIASISDTTETNESQEPLQEPLPQYLVDDDIDASSTSTERTLVNKQPFHNTRIWRARPGDGISPYNTSLNTGLNPNDMSLLDGKPRPDVLPGKRAINEATQAGHRRNAYLDASTTVENNVLHNTRPDTSSPARYP